MNQTDTLLLQCAHTVKATGCVSMARAYRAMIALLEPLAKDDPGIAHALSVFASIVITDYTFWLSWTLAPYAMVANAFEAAPVDASLEEISRMIISTAFDTFGNVMDNEAKVEMSRYFEALDIVDKLRLAALERFNDLRNA